MSVSSAEENADPSATIDRSRLAQTLGDLLADPVLSLPLALAEKVFHLLSVSDRLLCRQVSRAWRALLSQPRLWLLDVPPHVSASWLGGTVAAADLTAADPPCNSPPPPSPPVDRFTIGGSSPVSGPSEPPPLLPRQPRLDAAVVDLPAAVAEAFRARMAAHPRILDFSPNLRPGDDAVIDQFSRLAAVAIYDALSEHAPEALPLLQQLECAYKGSRLSADEPPPPHAPHVVFRNLAFPSGGGGGGGAAAVPLSDDPRTEPSGYFHRSRPELSELFLPGLNALLGFRRLRVSGEKGGVPVHHHVPMPALADSRTSVCFRTPIAVHTEDVHSPFFYGHFYLLGKVGNAEAQTPLMSVRSFLSAALPGAQEAKESERLLRGMRLPFLHRPGAGRVDAAAERLVAPLLDSDWDGGAFLRFNGADYRGIRSGERIIRHEPLPPHLYASSADHALAVWTLDTLRARFREFRPSPPAENEDASLTGCCWPLAIGTGDLVLVSNRTGPHSRTPFEGPRYVQRLYADYDPGTWWGAPRTLAARAEAWRREEAAADAAAVVMMDSSSPRDTALGRLESTVWRLRYLSQDAPYLLEQQGRAAQLGGPVGRLQALLALERPSSLPPSSSLPLLLTADAAAASQQQQQDLVARLDALLAPLVMQLTRDSVEAELERVRRAVEACCASSAPDVSRLVDELGAALLLSRGGGAGAE